MPELNSMGKIKIIKAFGKTENFSERKLVNSLARSGAGSEIINKILPEITSQIKDGMSTREIYTQAFELLKQYSTSLAGRYKLKQVINELGPTGFPFELYVAEILRHEGYQVNTGQIAKGLCVNHEIDIVAQNEIHHFMIECKFHNAQGTHSDVKIPLYVQSRFLDVAAEWKKFPGHNTRFHQAWIVTNTRFTEDAISYGTCMGINLISWSYPSTLSLKDRIDASGLHPITCLTTLTKREKQILLEKKIVLCRHLCQQPELLREIGIKNEQRITTILSEGKQVCIQTANKKHAQ